MREDGTWLVRPDDRRIYVPIKISADYFAAHKEQVTENEGNKVVVKITEWKDKEPAPSGEIVQVIGKKGDHETEIQSIILDRGIDTTFPEAVNAEAHALERSEKPLNQTEISKRRDFRQTFTFTIDPADAKDFDDAISFKDLGNDTYEVGVHIADVSYYVREGTELDTEAKRRACSVYLVDRTIPMLPEVLSNDLCSLNPHEEKFAFSAVFNY